MMNAFPQQGARIHGGPDRHGVPLHDFSTNSNACAPCPAALQAVRQADASQYPDASYTALRGQLAGFHGVDATRIVLAGSASEFIFRITALAAQTAHTAGEGGAVWLPPHSYGDYAQAARAHRLTLASEPGQAQLLWACEPSSPLGAAQAGLGDMADACAAKAMLVLDRAYEPLRLGGAPSLSKAQLQTVWQLWTPNKALGLTGVRAAYAIAPVGAQAQAFQLDQLSPSWPVGAHGVALLQAWTDGGVQAWLADSLDTLRDWKARQIALCESMGWTCLPSDANFFCARPALPEGLSLQQALDRLRSHGIKLRDTASFGLPGHVRISVQPPLAQDALHNAWQQLIKASQ
ncbi:aminotransferase class I/II-fold pyridoxal phosphate-dependent enzyme [Polaromonas naphthalenivorans]|uniref:histidinol-phosphate transaminase n=1 Tax=Polaromonas naphthalenivorans (strain CJ2) TaxID=365044 RepID=A1VP77_POLNA|nr:aminotransferase class I/II-fold pyridoxal phosphate-dependent enzyme [Polaromonas naphthalenivorans]ABM37455.1 aminotransferase [Polaromonas naphthalenivorans CJ2]